MEQTTLYFKQGSSDKVYQATIEPYGSGWLVNFAYGRRGANMTTGTKTPTAVDYATAKAICGKLIHEKVSKGYTTGENQPVYQHTDKIPSGIECQLLTPIEHGDVATIINDPAYWMQEKHDGRRMLIKKQGNSITGINRLGFTIALPATLIKTAEECRMDFIMDGEAIGGDFHAFDLLAIGGEDIRSMPYGERYLRLLTLLPTFQHRHIHIVETAFNAAQKAKLFQRLKDQNREGVVFKEIKAPYTAGRPSSAGPQRKYKFCETASFIVTRINTKRSVSLMLFDGDRIKQAGNVTIPPNHDIPAIGQVVECRYLYAFKESGAIYQPVYLGRRDDITPEECTVAQLKFKPEQEVKAA